MESPKFSLNTQDLKRLAIHLLWYALGYALIAVVRELDLIDFGTLDQEIGLAAGFVIDSISRFLSGK